MDLQDPGIAYMFLRWRRRREQLRQRRALRVQLQRLRDESNPFDLPEGIFRGKYRLSRDLARALADELRPHLPQGQRATRVPVELRVSTTACRCIRQEVPQQRRAH